MPRSPSSSRRLAPALGTAAVAVTLGACGADDLRPDVRYQLIGLPPVTDGACPAPGTTPPMVAGASQVRLTFRDQLDRSLRCDVVLSARAAPPYVSVPEREAPVTMYVEYFDDAGTLLARGERAQVTLTGGATVPVHVQPTNAFVCPLGATAVARAFHSATPLPNGEVLLLGGLVGQPGGDASAFAPSAGAYVSSAAEIYNPAERRFYPLTITGVLPRAFHEVVVLGMDGPVIRLLVLGGLGVAGDPSATGNIAALPTGGTGAPWTAVAADAGMGRAGAIALPAELLLYDPATRTVTRSEVAGGPTPRLFGAATHPDEAAGGLAVVGGRDGAGAAVASAEAVRPDGTSGGTVAGRPRVGATVTALSPTEALVWGGDLAVIADNVRAGDRLTALDGTPALAQGPAATGADNRAFHAATRFGDQVLVVGGLPVAGGQFVDAPFTPFIQAVDPLALTPQLVDVPGTTPAVYPAAVTLAGGDVLFTGGASPGVCASTLTCPIAQSVRVRPGAPPTAAATGAPGLARYGHRLTRLPDGTVLVTGGLSPASEPDKIRALRDAELFSPHEAADDPIADLGLDRAPGDVARAPGGAPLAPCTLVGDAPDLGLDAGAD